MFFVLSKTLGFFATPSNAIATLCVLGVVLLATRWRRAGRWVLGAGVALLLIAGYSPLGNLLLLPLSERFPAWTESGRAPDGIIVLGGAIDSDVGAARNIVALGGSGDRVMAMLDLARRFPAAKIVYSGGSGNLIDTSATEAPFAEALLRQFGVAPERIVLEGESRSTAENATLVRALVAPKPGELWLLVTSAWHMPRSIGVFRAAGLNVTAYPVDWRTRGWRDVWSTPNSLAGGLSRIDLAAHEWVGLIAYRLGGKTATLLPSP